MQETLLYLGAGAMVGDNSRPSAERAVVAEYGIVEVIAFLRDSDAGCAVLCVCPAAFLRGAERRVGTPRFVSGAQCTLFRARAGADVGARGAASEG